MSRNLSFELVCILLIACFAPGCKPKPSAQAPASSAYFKTPFQSESQFIVEAIVSDLAEQMYYAAHKRLPDKAQFSVTATEKSGSPVDAPVYELQIRLDPKQGVLKQELSINGPIWSPAVYQSVAESLAHKVGLNAPATKASEDTTLLSKLTDSSAETIEEQNQSLSADLESDIGNATLHEKAALLLGAFTLRDHSRYFFEIRSPLSRMTAHLAMARFLHGTGACGINGRLAEAMMLVLINNSAPALGQLSAFDTNNAPVAAVVRALQAISTSDYRQLDKTEDRSPMENVAWFLARATSVGPALPWTKLSVPQHMNIDLARAANHVGHSVEMGHNLLRVSIPLELQEIGLVYNLSRHEKLTRPKLIGALNELPERCFSVGPDGKARVLVIGWGQWANFLQRHLCHAVQQNFFFMNYQWGVPDDARKFSKECDRQFAALRLYPFVRRFNCTTVEAYHQSVDDAFKVTVATPHLVPIWCWNYLCYTPACAPLYSPNPNPHVNEWHSHNPPPGTVYNLAPRLNHPSLIDRPDVVTRCEKLLELAPYDCHIADFLVTKKYADHPSYDQAMALYQPVLPYSPYVLQRLAETVHDKPEQYEKVMLQAAAMDPKQYYALGEYAIAHKQDDQAAEYYEKACAVDPDAVTVASYAEWRVRYFLKKGNTTKARQIADEAGEVYSHRGLQAKADFLEATADYAGAFQWFANIEERYEDSSPLINFCARYKAKTGSSRFDAEAGKRLKKLFPRGIEKVSANDLHGPPSDGVLIKEENDLLRSAGLREGDVIVSVYGIRVHNFKQYCYGRESKTTPELDLIVWQGGAYREFKPSPPQHRFDVDFGDYPAPGSRAH